MRWWRRRKQQKDRRQPQDRQAEAAMKILDQFEREHLPKNRSTDDRNPEL